MTFLVVGEVLMNFSSVNIFSVSTLAKALYDMRKDFISRVEYIPFILGFMYVGHFDLGVG